MKNVLILLLGLAIGAGGYWFVAHHSHGEAHEEAAKHAEEEKHGEEGQGHGALKLTKEQQAAAGLKFAQAEAVEIPRQITGYGRVLDPSSVVALAFDVQTARAAMDASNKDFERVKSLFAQNQNASARTLETAEAVLKRDRALLAAAEAKLQTAVGPRLAAKQNFSDVIDSVAKMQSALVRVDIVGEAPHTAQATFEVSPLANKDVIVEAEFMGPAPTSDATLQGQGYLGLVRTNIFAANTAIAATFDDTSEKTKGFAISHSAVLQNGDEVFVFVQAGEESFKKIPIEIGSRKGDRVFVTGDLSATDQIVVEGAHQILSISKAEPAE
jgi:hypothetical protein